MKRMNLREAETILVERVDKLGLKRIIHHEHSKDRSENYQVSTFIYLVPKEETELRLLNEADVRAVGVSNCSWKDIWNRRKGRVIATARALKLLDVSNDPGYQPRKEWKEETA